jgi:signal transduction histidine kinase
MFSPEKNNPVLSQYLAEEEIKGLRILVISYTVFILCVTLFFFLGKLMDVSLIEDWQFGILFLVNILSSLYAIFTIRKRKKIFCTKYILFAVMAVAITVGVYWTGSLWIFLGYYLLSAMASFFYNWKISVFCGLVCLFSFCILVYFTSKISLIEGVAWLLYFIPTVAVMTATNVRNFIFVKDIVKKNEEVEEAKTTLEIKIQARTRELRKLSGDLEKQVEERTKELQEKMVELGRFNKLAVGRELKMIELKGEIKELTAKLKRKTDAKAD